MNFLPETTVKGERGQIAVEHFEGDNITCLAISNEEHTQAFITTDSYGRQEWIAAFSAKEGSGTFVIDSGDLIIYITRVDSEYRISIRTLTDLQTNNVRASFNYLQAQKILRLLRPDYL